ncbi:MAG: nitroreductase family protein [Elusimicrobiota bacterium]
MDYNSLIELMRSRRSIRKFLPLTVPGDVLEKVIAAASAAPSGGNRQNWYFIAVTEAPVKNSMLDAVKRKTEEFAGKIDSPKAKKELLEYTAFYTFFADAPVVIAVIKKPYDSLAARIMERYGLSQERRSTADIQGPAAAIQNLILAAHSLGYGTCWMTGPMIAKTELERILELSPGDELMALVPLGKTDSAPAMPQRKELKEIYKII